MTIRYRTSRSPDDSPVMVDRIIRSAKDAAPTLGALLEQEPNEVFVILCLSTKCRAIAYHEVSRGTLDTTLVHPREVFKAALLSNAAALVLAHNHPSGDPTPSPEDQLLTQRLVDAGRILGITVVDHVIVGEGRWFSFRDAGHLPS
jgi:DNA repair protein RadC